MKTTFNLTTCKEDLDRYRDRADLSAMLRGFDGLEVMPLGPDPRGLLTPDLVVGVHLRCFPCWVDLWLGDAARLEREFGSPEAAAAYYGGPDRQVLPERIRQDLDWARRWQAEYVVFHVSDCTAEETFTGRYFYSDEQVIDASIDLLNQAFPADADGPWLLLENLWHPGLTFTRAEMTRRLLEGLVYPKTGLMLDTGHLMHTCPSLTDPDQAVDYIHRQLDRHGDLCDAVLGVHLNLSLTGAYAAEVRANPPKLAADYATRSGQMFAHIFRQDQHRPFLSPALPALLQRIGPRWLTYEFITENRAQHQAELAAQRQTLAALYRE